MDEEKNQDIKKSDEKLKSIHTYKSDVAEFIKSESKTMADIAIAETQKRSSDMNIEKGIERDWRKIIKIFIFTVVLILISIGAIWFVIKSLNKEEPAPIINTGEQKPSMFISDIRERNISITDLSAQDILEKINTTLKDAEPFHVIHFTEKIDDVETENVVGIVNFFEKVSIYPPGDLLRSVNQEFALGSVGGKVRFLVLKNHYYSGTFAGILQWEKNIYEDLKNLLNLPKMGSVGLGTTTSPKELKKAGFVDSIISNRDARILKDGAGNIILIYIFVDNETLVITSSESTMKIVAEKLLGSKIK